MSTITQSSAQRATLNDCCPMCKAEYVKYLQTLINVKAERNDL